MMTKNPVQKLPHKRKAMLAVAALGSFPVPILLAQGKPIGTASVQDTATQVKPAFEVATIKPVENGPQTTRFIKLEG